MTNFLDAIKNRRSIYALGRNVNLSETQIEELIKEAVKASPSAFNAQEARVVVLFGDAHEKLWDLTADALQPLTPAEAFEGTKQKLGSFKAGFGTVLFFFDQDTVTGLQEQFALYADNFPVWAEQSNGIAQANTWTALSEAGLGASLQHYNPVIDASSCKRMEHPSKLETTFTISIWF
jgi:Predicted oxidoreductase related to nitroreductase